MSRAPLFDNAPITVNPRTAALQQASSRAQAACSRPSFKGLACIDARVMLERARGGDLCGFVCDHWRGIVQGVIAVGAGGATFACLALVWCGIVGAVVIGGLAGGANYAVSGGKHTWAGFGESVAWGAGSGLLAGAAGAAFRFADGEEIIVSLGSKIGTEVPEEVPFRLLAQGGRAGTGALIGTGLVAMSGMYGAMQYLATTPSASRTDFGVLSAFVFGISSGLPFPTPKFINPGGH